MFYHLDYIYRFIWNNQQKQKHLQRLLSVFVERIFYSSEDIIWKCDRLSYPCSIKTFDYGIVLFPEMIVKVYNLREVKRFQIAKFKGCFDII